MRKAFVISAMSAVLLTGVYGESSKGEDRTPNSKKQESEQLKQLSEREIDESRVEDKKDKSGDRESEKSKFSKIDVKELYEKKCSSCHGKSGKTKAMGKSNIIAGGSGADIESKLKSYRDGKRDVVGMGNVMKSQASSLSDEEIKILAEYISG